MIMDNKPSFEPITEAKSLEYANFPVHVHHMD